MKRKNLTFSKKIIILLLSSIGFTILFSFFFIHYLYSKLYLTSIEESIIYQGHRTASHYHYGELSEEIIEKIQWYNIVSEYEIIVVDDLDELSSYFPYQINTQALLEGDDYETLNQGKYVMKEGYVKELDREIIGAIFPIRGEYELIGFIYIYVPLAAIQDVFKESIPLLIGTGLIFFCLLFIIVWSFWRSLFNPLKKLEHHAVEVANGNYENRLAIRYDDEVGQVAKTFNMMTESLEQQEIRQKEFISNIVHELRTPLTYVSGYTQALKQDFSSKNRDNYLNTIEKETERINKLITDLVDLSHLQEGLYTMTKQPLAIAQVLLDTIDLFLIHSQKKQIQLQVTVDEELIVLGDAKRIQQVFYNIIDNAIKYSKIDNDVFISLENDNEHAKFQVQNLGTVIDAEDIPYIGNRFFRTDKARNRTTGGTGLGLSIVKEITRLHDGQFSITSDVNDGTIVTVQLPLL
ncbi:cell wall metabolism sensor histidine kinase WalK [Sporosarcina pasteurii]|uniref:histidine kinase n=1 Tax=Sporosarcina pasteurii TaxID=1474 RepID=A0A380C9D9_SPOPA|nr:HAMP domain-containing sensor histidine kinase [Sporosarcina pasteurii]MDS9473051.1 HAMP domain-containing sensor histidine kinase [Sporosarcina pasteurii]QBQ04559.1 HAMP domain-containing histidine kinase [Sporosarcina pasteurii]SUJ14174.1 Alkaline phosphatase synthesis sensor protein phoR [Sporosarcina pasteurii]